MKDNVFSEVFIKHLALLGAKGVSISVPPSVIKVADICICYLCWNAIDMFMLMFCEQIYGQSPSWPKNLRSEKNYLRKTNCVSRSTADVKNFIVSLILGPKNRDKKNDAIRTGHVSQLTQWTRAWAWAARWRCRCCCRSWPQCNSWAPPSQARAHSTCRHWSWGLQA